jgi:lysophospholipase L1-like esterase
MTSPSPKPGRQKRLWQKLALAGGTLVLFLVAAEVGLRFLGYGNLEVYEPDPKLYWRLKPNQDCFTKVDHQPVHINSHGTRGPEFALEKPANTFRILSLGDSRTFGWGLADEETYSRRLERLLQERFGSAKAVEVINAGVNAWSFPQMLVFYRDIAAAWKPDAVILAEANLWTQFSEKNSDEFVKKFMARVRLKNLLRRSAIYHFAIEVKLQAFYARYRTKFIPVDPQKDALFKEQQQSDPDAVFRSAIESLCQAANGNRVSVTLLFLPMLDDLSVTNPSRVLAAKQAVSAKLGVPLVDLTRDLAAGGKRFYLEADPVHLNAAGNAIVASRLFESITNNLAK